MPTSGKAAGAILLAVVAAVVAAMIVPHLPVAIPRGPAYVAAVIFGSIGGWRMGGDRRGGLVSAAARGVTAAAAAALATLCLGAVWEMLRRSLRGIYDGPVEALDAVVALLADYGRLLLAPAPAASLILGGALAGVLAAAVARRWS